MKNVNNIGSLLDVAPPPTPPVLAPPPGPPFLSPPSYHVTQRCHGNRV